MPAQTGAILARLDAADGAGALLAAAWDGFEHLLIAAGTAADPGSASFAALQMAAAAAAEGRDAIGHAPSMPATAGPADPAILADAAVAAGLTDLASALRGRLSHAAGLAGPAADRAAFGQAAAHAETICDLLGD